MASVGGRKRRGKPEKDVAPEIDLTEGHISFEQGLRRFLKISAATVSEAKRRRFFVPKLTRSCRRRRGREMERRRRERDE